MPTQREILLDRQSNIKQNQMARFKAAQEKSGLDQGDFVKRIEQLKVEDPTKFQQFTQLIGGQQAGQPNQTNQAAPMDTTTGAPQGVQAPTLPKETPTPVPEGMQPGGMPTPPPPPPTSTQQIKSKLESDISTQQIQEFIPQPPAGITTPQKVDSAIKSGQLLVGSKEYEVLKQAYPEVIAAYEQKSQVDRQVADINLTGTVVSGGTVPRQERASDQILTFLTKNLDTNSADRFQREVLNDPDLKIAYEGLDEVNRELNEIDDNLDSLGDEIRESFTGGVPEARLQARIAKEARPLIKQRGQVLDELQIRQAEVTRLSENAREMFQLKLQDAARIQDFAFQVYGIQRADEIRQEDLALREQDYIREIERNDFEYNRALQDGRALDAERFLRDREVLEEERGYNEALAIDNALIQVGIDPGVQSKEEKMQALARFNNQQIEFEKSLQTAKGQIDIFNAQKGNWVVDRENGIKYNKDTGEYEIIAKNESGMIDLSTVMSAYSEQGQNLLSVPDGTVLPTRLGNVSPQNASIRGKECAEYVNDIVGEPGKRLGDSLESKLAVCNESTGVVGSVASWKPKGSGNFGHTGIIVGDMGDSWEIKSSNYTPGTVTTDLIPKSAIDGYYTPQKVKNLYQSFEPVIRSADIAGFNNPSFKPQDLKGDEKVQYQKFLDDKKAVMDDKDTDINTILEYSVGGKQLTAEPVKTLTKYDQALTQLDAIQKQIKKIDTGPILGRIKNLNPYDTDAQVLARSLNALIPNLARGVYGEVGVLTDNDIRIYSETVPNLKQTSDVNKAILALTLDTVAGGYKKQLRKLAAAGYDVSGFTGDYDSIKSQADSLRAELGISLGTGNSLSQDDRNEALSIK